MEGSSGSERTFLIRKTLQVTILVIYSNKFYTQMQIFINFQQAELIFSTELYQQLFI